jgi:hypothetical protein
MHVNLKHDSASDQRKHLTHPWLNSNWVKTLDPPLAEQQLGGSVSGQFICHGHPWLNSNWVDDHPWLNSNWVIRRYYSLIKLSLSFARQLTITY